MFYRITEIQEITRDSARKLEKVGITTTEHLLAKGSDAKARGKLALETGVGEKYLTRWVAQGDLMRIKGVGSEYSELLEAAGVDTIRKLGTRVPGNLHAKLTEVNTAKNLVRRTPTENEVSAWVAEAKTLPAMVSH